MMSRLTSVVKRHPLITFFVLVYALAWLIESPLVFLTDSVTGTQGLILTILSSNVPSVVAIVLTAVVFGRGALRKLLGQLLIWRVNPLWYLAVVLGPVALVGGMVVLNTLLGGPALSLGMPLVSVAIYFGFSIFPGSALGEEIGWRGYVLPRLQSRMSALSAALLIAPIWALWHLPLWLTGTPGRTPLIYAGFVVSVFALSVLLTWVYNSTGGSLLLVVLAHATFNLPITILGALGDRVTVPVLLYFGLMAVAAIVVVIVAGPKHLSRKRRKQEEKEAEVPEATTPTVPPVPRPA